MDEETISKAREEMEGMLKGLERVIHEEGSGYCLLSKDHPKLIGRGDLALVFGLSDGIIGKIVFYEVVEQPPNNYCLAGLYVGAVPHIMERTVKALREMGFDNVLDHVEIERYPNAKSGDKLVHPYFYHFSPDLREGGRYDVYSIEDFPFDDVQNGQELRTQMDTSLARIKSEIESGKYILEVDHHGTKDKPDEALRKMFIGRVDKQTNQGELFFADLDHCVIYRDTRTP